MDLASLPVSRAHPARHPLERLRGVEADTWTGRELVLGLVG